MDRIVAALGSLSDLFFFLLHVGCLFASFRPASDALLRSCLDDSHHFLVSLSRLSSASSGGAAASSSMLLHGLSSLLTLVVHAHPLVSEVGRAVWIKLHHSLDPATFHRFALELVVQMLLQSVQVARQEQPPQQQQSTLNSAPASSSDFVADWTANKAQLQLVELLAQVAPLLSRDDQVSSNAACASSPVAFVCALLCSHADPVGHVMFLCSCFCSAISTCCCFAPTRPCPCFPCTAAAAVVALISNSCFL
jgi:hypothetical protein